MLEGTESARLKFEKLTKEYKPQLVEFFSHAEATKYFNPIPDPDSFVDLWLEKLEERYKKHGCGFYALIDKETNEFIGQCGILIQTLDGEDTTHHEVGYHLMPAHWGKGYASEAAQYCRDQVFKANMADEVISIIHVDNERSKKVARRNGMKVIRSAKFREWPVEIFAISRQEWENL